LALVLGNVQDLLVLLAVTEMRVRVLVEAQAVWAVSEAVVPVLVNWKVAAQEGAVLVVEDLTAKLETELERLKRFLRLGHHLRVKWIPNDGKLSGEVNGDCIYVYEEEEKLALETLRHEFLDYAISQAIEPYKEIANRLILMMNDGAYRRKEKLVEALSQLVKE
jgi:hypothetical protein